MNFGYEENPSSLTSPRICQLLQRAVAGGFRVRDGQRKVLGGLRPPNVVFNQNSVIEKPIRSLTERTVMPLKSTVTPIQQQSEFHPVSPGAHVAYGGGFRPGARSLSPGEAQGGDLWPKLWGDSPSGTQPGDVGIRTHVNGSMSVTPTHPWRRHPGGTTDEQNFISCDTELLPECFISEVVPTPRPQSQLTPRRWAARMLYGHNTKEGSDQGIPEGWWPATTPDAATVQRGTTPSTTVRPWELPRTTPISRRATIESADDNLEVQQISPSHANNVANGNVSMHVPSQSHMDPFQNSQSMKEASIKEASQSQQEPEPEISLSEPSLAHNQLPSKPSEQEPESRHSQECGEFYGDKQSENSTDAHGQAIHNMDNDQIAIIGSENLKTFGGIAGCLSSQMKQREQRDQLWNANEAPWAPLGPTFGKAQRKYTSRGRPNSASRKPPLKAKGQRNAGPMPGSELQVRSLLQSPQEDDGAETDVLVHALHDGRGSRNSKELDCRDLTLADLPGGVPKAVRRSSQTAMTPGAPTKAEVLRSMGPTMPKDLRRMTRSISPPPTPPPQLDWPPQGTHPAMELKRKISGPPKPPPATLHEMEVQTGAPALLLSDQKAHELVAEPKLSGRKVITKRRLEEMNLTSWKQVSLDRNTPEEVKEMQYKSALRYHFPGGLTAAM